MKRRASTVVVISVALLLAAVACHRTSTVGAQQPGVSPTALDSSSVLCLGAEGPCYSNPATECQGVWSTAPLALPDWASQTECLQGLAHTPAQYYDDCAFDQEKRTPEHCGAPSRGATVCQPNGTSDVGRRTQTCVRRTDCPAGMACVLEGAPVEAVPRGYWSGICERQCTGTTPGECLRCDMECDVEKKICRQRRPDPGPQKTCVSDCQCPDGICDQGRCNNETGAARWGLCGPGGDCACNGGTCIGECCHLPDGSIAGRFSPACAQNP